MYAPKERQHTVSTGPLRPNPLVLGHHPRSADTALCGVFLEDMNCIYFSQGQAMWFVKVRQDDCEMKSRFLSVSPESLPVAIVEVHVPEAAHPHLPRTWKGYRVLALEWKLMAA